MAMFVYAVLTAGVAALAAAAVTLSLRPIRAARVAERLARAQREVAGLMTEKLRNFIAQVKSQHQRDASSARGARRHARTAPRGTRNPASQTGGTLGCGDGGTCRSDPNRVHGSG